MSDAGGGARATMGTLTGIGAVILAAGTGARFGGGFPKQFVELAGLPAILWPAKAFRDAGLCPIAAVSPAWVDYCRDRLDLPVIEGGSSRTDTVRRALAWAQTAGLEWIFLHAATRPLLTPGLIRHMVAHRGGYDGLVAAESIVGGLVDAASGIPGERERYRIIASPELVAVASLAAALSGRNDDRPLAAELLLLAGQRVGCVDPGGPNLKITTAPDIAVAAALLRAGLPEPVPSGPFPLGRSRPGRHGSSHAP